MDPPAYLWALFLFMLAWLLTMSSRTGSFRFFPVRPFTSQTLLSLRLFFTTTTTTTTPVFFFPGLQPYITASRSHTHSPTHPHTYSTHTRLVPAYFFTVSFFQQAKRSPRTGFDHKVPTGPTHHKVPVHLTVLVLGASAFCRLLAATTTTSVTAPPLAAKSLSRKVPVPVRRLPGKTPLAPLSRALAR